MNVSRDSAVALLVGCGRKNAKSLNDAKLLGALQGLPDKLDDESLAEAQEAIEDKGALKLLKAIAKDPTILEDVEILAESNGASNGSAKAAKKGGKKAAAVEPEDEDEDEAEEEDADEAEEGDEEEEGDEDTETDEDEEEDEADEEEAPKAKKGKGKAQGGNKATKEKTPRPAPIKGATLRVSYQSPRGGENVRVLKNRSVACALYREMKDKGAKPKFLDDCGLADSGASFANAEEALAAYEKKAKKAKK